MPRITVGNQGVAPLIDPNDKPVPLSPELETGSMGFREVGLSCGSEPQQTLKHQFHDTGDSQEPELPISTGSMKVKVYRSLSGNFITQPVEPDPTIGDNFSESDITEKGRLIASPTGAEVVTDYTEAGLEKLKISVEVSKVSEQELPFPRTKGNDPDRYINLKLEKQYENFKTGTCPSMPTTTITETVTSNLGGLPEEDNAEPQLAENTSPKTNKDLDALPPSCRPKHGKRRGKTSSHSLTQPETKQILRRNNPQEAKPSDNERKSPQKAGSNKTLATRKLIPSGSLQEHFLTSGLNEIHAFQNAVYAKRAECEPQRFRFPSPDFNSRIQGSIKELEALGTRYHELCFSNPHIGHQINELSDALSRSHEPTLITQCQFPSSDRGKAAFILGGYYHNIRDALCAYFSHRDTQDFEIAAILSTFLNSHLKFLQWLIESRLRDLDAIKNVDFTPPASKSKGRRHKIKGIPQPEIKEPRCRLFFLNEAVDKLCTALATVTLFFQQRSKPEAEYITDTRQQLFQLISRYREEATTTDFDLFLKKDSFIEQYLFEAELIHAAVSAEQWEIATTLLTEICQRFAPPDPTIKSVIDAVVADDATVQEITRVCAQWKIESQQNRRFPLAHHLALGLDATIHYFRHAIEQIEAETLVQNQLMKTGELQTLASNLHIWVEKVDNAGMLGDQKHLLDKSFFTLLDIKQQLIQITQKNEKRLAEYFEEIENPFPEKQSGNSKKRQTVTGQKCSNDVRYSDRQKSSTAPNVSTPQQSIPTVTDDKENDSMSLQGAARSASSHVAVDIQEVAGIAAESPPSPILNETEGEWLQIRRGVTLRNDEILLAKINEGLDKCELMLVSTELTLREQERVIHILETRESKSHRELLCLAYARCSFSSARMVQCLNDCKALIAQIKPYMTKILVDNTLSSHEESREFKRHVDQFNDSNRRGLTEFNKIHQQLARLNELQCSSEDITLRDNLYRVIQETLSQTHEALSQLGTALLAVFQKRLQMIKSAYPELREREKKHGHDACVQQLKKNNQSLEKQRKRLEKYQEPAVLPSSNPTSEGQIVTEQQMPTCLQLPPTVFMEPFQPRLLLQPDRSPAINHPHCLIPCVQTAIKEQLTGTTLVDYLVDQLKIQVSTYDTRTKLLYTRPYHESEELRPENPETLASKFASYTYIEPECDENAAAREDCHEKVSLAARTLCDMSVFTAYTGSRAYQKQIERHWGNERSLQMDHIEYLPEVITPNCIHRALTPRDTDLIALGNEYFYQIVQHLSERLHQIAQERSTSQVQFELVTYFKENDYLYSASCSSSHLVVRKAGTDRPKDWLYVVDLAAYHYPDQHILSLYRDHDPSNNAYIKCCEAIIMDELNLVMSMSAGPERALRAVIRICHLAQLESSEPKLDSLSRMALIHALDTINQRYPDPKLETLLSKLRDRVFNLISHERLFWGVSQVWYKQTN